MLTQAAYLGARAKRPTGYVLYEGPSALDGNPIVAVVTGLARASSNAKTGAMAQVWILRADVSPLRALETGADYSICGGCRHRGTRPAQRRATPEGRTCYVQVARAPQTVWHAYRRGRYPLAEGGELVGRLVRLGAYGDPLAVPSEVWAEALAGARGWTGYTHQWQAQPAHPMRSAIMASADTASEASWARANGWRYFRVTGNSEPSLPREVTCPASSEAGQRTTCHDCRLCSGTRGPDDRRASITILGHGPGARRLGVVR